MFIYKDYNIDNSADFNALVHEIWKKLYKAKNRYLCGYGIEIESKTGRFYYIDFSAVEYWFNDYVLIIENKHGYKPNYAKNRYTTRTALYKDLRKFLYEIIADYRNGNYIE